MTNRKTLERVSLLGEDYLPTPLKKGCLSHISWVTFYSTWDGKEIKRTGLEKTQKFNVTKYDARNKEETFKAVDEYLKTSGFYLLYAGARPADSFTGCVVIKGALRAGNIKPLSSD